MDENNERRKERRLRYHWPVWFAEDFNSTLNQGQMVDISSIGAAFTCHADESCPHTGQHITARFSIPRYESDESFDMTSFVRSGQVCRVDDVNSFIRCVAVQFAEPLPFKPGEQDSGEVNTSQRFDTAIV